MGTPDVVIKASASGIRSSDFLTVVSSHCVRETLRRSNSATSKSVPCSTTEFVDSADFCSIMMKRSPLWVARQEVSTFCLAFRILLIIDLLYHTCLKKL